MIREELQLAVDAAQWRKTDYVRPHEYIVQHTHPALFADLTEALQSGEGVHPGTFGGRECRYLYVGEYKYWRIEDVVNRELLTERAAGSGQGEVGSNSS